MSLDYIFGRTDNPQGKLYHYEPEALKVKSENQADMERFVEMCFNPDSSISAKLKETRTDISNYKQKQRLVNTFINAIYLYNDKIILTFNYKNGSKTISLNNIKSSDLGTFCAPKAPRSDEQVSFN